MILLLPLLYLILCFFFEQVRFHIEVLIVAAILGLIYDILSGDD